MNAEKRDPKFVVPAECTPWGEPRLFDDLDEALAWADGGEVMRYDEWLKEKQRKGVIR